MGWLGTATAGAAWAGCQLPPKNPVDARRVRRFLASKGFFVGLDNSPHQVHAVELAHEAQVMSEACRKLRRATCCVIGTLRTHTIRCQRGPTKINRADAESPPKSRPFRLDARSYSERESHGHLLCLLVIRTLKSFLG